MKKTFTVFGDSIAKGIVLEDDKIQICEQNTISYIENHYNIKIQSSARYGLSLKKLMQRNVLLSYVQSLDHSKINYAIFSIGGNDADFDWENVSKDPNSNHSMKTPLSTFTSLLNEAICLLQKHGVVVVLCTIMPINSTLYFENVISKIADGKKVLQFLNNDLTNIHRVQECYNTEIVKCAYRTNCILLDVRTPMQLTKDNAKYFCKDGIHPNSEGYKYLADLYIEQINSNYQQFYTKNVYMQNKLLNYEDTEKQNSWQFCSNCTKQLC